MSVKPQVDSATIGKRFAELVRERDLPVKGLWVRQTVETIEMWVVAEHSDLKDGLPVQQAIVDLHREYPNVLFDDRVLNTAWIPNFNDAHEIPPSANRIELRG